MSEIERTPRNLNHSQIMEIPEIYAITKGIRKDFDLKGYHVPSTSMHSPRIYKFPAEKKKDTFYAISKRAKDPDPTAYSPKHEQINQRFWNKANGKFL